ncbi:MAG: protease complex subunit PrcB family protein [Elusimicrobia bacterium]|nr:protease complex subunit PrcB family protein [Elusimicrobiota bacterium]
MGLRRRNPFLALAAALLLGAACKRAPAPVVEETPELAPPEPSSSLIATPLDSASTGFTNEMQAANLTRETTEMGIQHISKHIEEGAPGRDPRAAPPRLSKVEKKERLEQLKEMREEFTLLRRGIDAQRDKTVALPGTTAAIIKGRESGGILGAVEDGPGVWSGAYGGAVETGERVVADASAWAELWGRVSRETPPEVDFGKTRVAAVFVGPRPTSGYRAKLIGIEVEPTRYLVRWYEEGPAADEAVAEGATAPFLLVSVPKDERGIRWDKKRRAEGPKTK